jgi:tetratricopeptide (TPR) repeat protein
MYRFCAKNEEYLDAIKYYNEIIGKNALFFPALIEKGKLHLQMKKYHELKGLVEEAMVKSNEHFEALLLLTMYQYLAGNSKSQRIENLGKIVTILKGFKTTKNDVIFHVSQFFARTCGCDKRSLDLTKSLVELICKLDPSNEEYRLEHGYHLRRLKKYNEAIADYQFSSSLDTNDSSGLQGMILAQVLNGNIEDAKAQKDFISVMGNVCARQVVANTAQFIFYARTFDLKYSFSHSQECGYDLR